MSGENIAGIFVLILFIFGGIVSTQATASSGGWAEPSLLEPCCGTSPKVTLSVVGLDLIARPSRLDLNSSTRRWRQALILTVGC
jgi:hypothetical protein